jgi:hypothetical protein
MELHGMSTLSERNARPQLGVFSLPLNFTAGGIVWFLIVIVVNKTG